MKFAKDSYKAKTVFSIFSFFMILFAFTVWFRYVEFKQTIEDSEAASSIRIMNVYQDSIERVFSFFTTCGEIRILSKDVRNALTHHDKNSINILLKDQWEGLRHTNQRLKDIQFYGANLNPIHSFSNTKFMLHAAKNLKVKEPYGTFFIFNSSFDYHIILPVYEDQVFIGAIDFIIDPMYFLEYINESLGVKAMIFINDSIGNTNGNNSTKTCTFKLLTSSLDDEVQARKLFNDVAICNKESLSLGEKKFITHILNSFDHEGKTLAKFVFLQDVTQQSSKLTYWIKKNIILYSIILILTLITLVSGFNILTKRLEIANKKLKESEDSLLELNKSLEVKVNKEIQKRLVKEQENSDKERIIIRQDKLASMGEMIGNIAHQWRQPLTELNSILIRLDLSYEHGSLNKKSLEKMIKKSNQIISHMSNTIDDFRNFFASNEKIKDFCINSSCKKVFDLMGASLRNNHIDFKVYEEKNFYIRGLEGEIIQAILNIIANAKDILIDRSIQKPVIWFSIFERNNRCVIQIKDNAGGVQFEPISKIFEPYITSKHANAGTGIGLYMTKTIIEKNSNGSLSVYNGDEGAVFEIIFY